MHIVNLSKLVQKFIERCVLCRRTEAKHQNLEISDKWILRKGTGASEGLYTSVGLDIGGPFRYKMGTKNTRSTKVGKACVLFISCQISSACNAVIMENYSVSGFMDAFETHCAMTRRPARITSDAGSQFRSVANRTRAAQKLANESTESEGISAADLFEGVAKKMKNVEFFLAASSAQWQNGLCEANFKSAKTLMKKLTTQFQQVNFVFRSALAINALFQKVCAILNNRPIFFGESADYYISARSLTCPGTVQTDAHETIRETSKAWDIFLNEFDTAVITGSFQKHGIASTTKKHGLMINDFVMVVYQTQGVRRYGIVTDIPSPHNISVKILHKTSIGKEQNFCTKG